MIALFAGSFHPPTLGHMDIINTAARLFDEVIVAVMINAQKTYTISAEERVEMFNKACAGLKNVKVVADSGLTAELAKRMGAGVLVRGVRSAADFEYELPIADVNRAQYGLDTVFIPALPEHGFISSTIVADIAAHGGAIKGLVPQEIECDVIKLYRKGDAKWKNT